MVTLDDVSFSYSLKGKALPVLANINASFEKGSISAIVGRSGCGKTSLLRVIAGLSNPSSGRVLIGGAPSKGIRDKTSIIFQDYGLLPWATVQTNAELGLKARGVPAAERTRRVNPILEEMGLSGFSRLYPLRLSGGMQQRVAVARALAADSDLLLMDEPFSSLDAITRESLQDTLLEAQHKHGTTIIMVTHSIEEAAYLADTVYVLEGKNPSSLSVRFETGRRSPETNAGVRLPLRESMMRESTNKAPARDNARSAEIVSGKPPAIVSAETSYRESTHYFRNIAALRQFFSDSMPKKENGVVEEAGRSATQDADHGAIPGPEKSGQPLLSTAAGSRHAAAGFFARLGQIVLAGLFIAVVWALLSRLVGKAFLPSPTVAASRFAQRLGDGTLLLHSGKSLQRISLALLAAGPLAWALGLAAGRVHRVDRVASPLVYLLHPLPKVAFLPLLMLFLGLGDASKVALMGLVIFGQLFVGARDSAKAVPASLIDTVRSLGGPASSILRYAILPATLPSLLSSLRISLGTAIAVLFLSETFASMDGLGWYIMDSWSRVDYPDMYAAIMALSLVGLALYLLLDAVESALLRWRETD